MITTKESLLLTIPELRLSLKLLGYEKWNDLPLIMTDESVEQRLINALLQLIQKGCFEAYDGGYRMKDEFRKKMIWIGQADDVYQVWEKEQIAAFVYEKESGTLLISPDLGRMEGCKITVLENCRPEDIIKEMPDFMNQGYSLELKKAEKGNEQPKLEQLIYFHGAAMVMEEAE